MPKAFVLMPFDDDFDAVYLGLIEPPLKEAGFDITRADLSINQQQILKDIVNGLATADLVVVDVSGLNGNVMYELGLAHAMGRRTVMITRDIDELPFDLQAYRANEYSTNFAEAPKLISRLREIADGVISGTADFSNPVQDFAPEFLGKRDQVSQAPVRLAAPGGEPDANLDGDPSEDREALEPEGLGLLDYIVSMSETSDAVIQITELVGGATTEVGEKMTARTAQIERTQKNLGEKAAPVLRSIMRETAKDFDTFSDVLDEQNPLLAAAITSMATNANGIARLRGNVTDDARKQLEEEITSLLLAEDSFKESYESTATFATTIAELPSMERTLTIATKRASKAVLSTADTINSGRSEFARVRGLLQERLDDETQD